IFLVASSKVSSILRDFAICHDDFNLKPADGVLKEHTFTWLGFVQYTHVTTGLPHHSKAPRVVLIQRQFAVGTATDMLHLPKNYKLGNVVFGDYERDEEDCGLTRLQAKIGSKCPRAYIEMPIVDITPHPEFSRFGVGNSLALVKFLRPMRSQYVVPICLPSVVERKRKRRNRMVFMVDYISTVPRDFDTERMGKKTLKLFTHKDCRRHRMKMKLGSEGVTHVLCSSGCGVRPGAPIVSHSPEGMFEVLGIAAGGAACSRRSSRRRLNSEPPLYIDVYPYITWIINVITAHVLPRPYSHNFKLVEGGSSIAINKGNYLRARKVQKAGWRARTYVTGNACFKSERRQRANSLFYSEKFEVNADPPAKLNIFMKISAGIECTIMCARLLMPNRLATPKIEGVGGYNISVEFTTEWFPYTFYFSLGLTGKNTTEKDFLEWIGERKPGFW
ncbi:melanization protease 1-like, partial [Ostrinia furnacalis]|uniref:melanization protease 1-like n=1 Tax=Ostrinia furnacalis TaxID=93504 RepID=UPI001039C609